VNMLMEMDTTAVELADRARGLAETFKETRRETEELRRVPDKNLELLRDAGLLRVIQSKRSGGHELSMRAHLDVVSAIAEGCPATAWVLGVAHAHSWIMAHFPHQAQDDVYGQNPDTMVAAVIGPRGKAVRQADGTYVLNGFWPFGSGSQLSEWLLLGAEVFDEKGEFLDLADLLVPTRDVEIKDDWYVAGLQGTGSCSLVVKDQQIPAHRYLSLMGLINRDTPGMKEGGMGAVHYGEAVPVLALALCGSSIGLGRAAVKEFKTSIQGKSVAYTEHVQTEWSSTHITYATGASNIDAGTLLLYRAADDIDQLSRLGEPMSMTMRGRMRMDCSHGVKLILEGADKLYIASGGSGLSLRSAMQQISRDMHAVNMHGLLLFEASAELYGRVLLDLEPNTIII